MIIKCPHCNAGFPSMADRLLAQSDRVFLFTCGYCDKKFYIEFIMTIKVLKDDPKTVSNASDK
jgi:hypothetical protein